MTVTVRPKMLLAGLALPVLCFSVGHFVSQYLKYAHGLHYQWGLEQQFNLVNEANATAWFSSMILLVSAGLLTVVARCEWETGGKDTRHWAGLAGIFYYLSLDEAAQIHEMFKLFDGLHPTGLFYYSWIIVGCVAVATVGVLYLGFLTRLPAESRWLFVLAGTLYVGGALGIEMLESRYQYVHGTWKDLPYALLVGVEETLEMSGITLFIYAIASYLARYGITFSLRFADDAATIAVPSPKPVPQQSPS